MLLLMAGLTHACQDCTKGVLKTRMKRRPANGRVALLARAGELFGAESSLHASRSWERFEAGVREVVRE